jgi:Septum formation
VVVFVLSGCSGGGGDDASDATTTTVVRSTATEVPLFVGQCGDVPRLRVGGALDPAEIVERPCTEPHQVEVGAVFDYPAGLDIDFPGTGSVDGYATDQCIERFEPYVGASYVDSTLDFLIVAPDEDGWDDGDRRIACILYQTNFDPLTTPVAGSGL